MTSFINKQGSDRLSKILYVRPGTDFLGVTLAANISGGGGGEQVVAWFTQEDMCVMNGVHWWEVWVLAELYKAKNNNS